MNHSKFAADDAGLRSDVRRLADLLGQTLVRQEGPELLELVEAVRKSVRKGSGEEVLANITDAESVQLARAFSTYLNLANVAEQIHRARVLSHSRATGGSWLVRAVDRIEEALSQQTPGHQLTKEEITPPAIEPKSTPLPAMADSKSASVKTKQIISVIALSRTNAVFESFDNFRC